MVPLMRVVTAVAVIGVVLAAPAAAAEDEYLDRLQDRYRFLTTEQLLTEGYRVCAVTNAGGLSLTAVNMVRDDLDVSINAALDIVTAAVVSLC
jgi:hypothetical protein